jgi:hypothetical protein
MERAIFYMNLCVIGSVSVAVEALSTLDNSIENLQDDLNGTIEDSLTIGTRSIFQYRRKILSLF